MWRVDSCEGHAHSMETPLVRLGPANLTVEQERHP